MKDYFGSPLNIGDEVAIAVPSHSSSSDNAFMCASVVAIAQMHIVIVYNDYTDNVVEFLLCKA